MANWTISYTDVFGKKKVESFTSQGAAQARYEELIPRTYGDLGDLVNVTAPVRSAVKVSEDFDGDVDLSNQWRDLDAVVKGLFIRGFDNPHGKYFYVKSDYRNEMDAVHSVYTSVGSHILDIHVLGSQFTDDPMVAIVNQGLQGKPFETACGVIEPVVQDWFNAVDDGYHGIFVKIDDPSEYAVWKKSKGFKNEDGASASSLGVAPTGVVRRKTEAKKNESENPIATIYGDGGINTYEHSADGFFPTDKDTLAKAIYNNDVETIKELHDSNLKTYEEPDEMTMGWHDDYDDFNDDSTHYWYYDWEWDYDQSFVEDFCRVIGLTDNQDALRLMLQYEPDFIVCPADFGNAIHAGYDKELIKKLFFNIRAVGDDDDLRINYLGDEDYVSPDSPDPIENIEQFLEV